MLEDFAWRYAMMSELQIWLFSIGFLAFGGVMAALLHRGTAVLNRAPYFALTALVTLGIALGQMIWLQGGQAMLHGWLSALIGMEAVFSLAAGYAMVVLGQARSRDALGHGRAGILSLVPLANLWLLFTPGQEPSRADPVIALLRGGMGVTVGLALMMLARGLSAGLEPMITERVAQVTEDPAHAATFVDIRLRLGDLPELLREVAVGTTVPEDLGDGFTLKAVQAEGLVLRYVYTLSGPDTELGYGAATEVAAQVCGDAMLSRLLKAGARLVFDYEAAGRATTGFGVTQTDCAV